MIDFLILLFSWSGMGSTPPPFQPSPYLWDSLNIRFVGGWRMGAPNALALDTTRNLLFTGSGSGVWILDITGPLAPTLISDRIQSFSPVTDLAYDAGAQRLIVSTRWYGLEIWDVSNPTAPYFLGAWRDSAYRFSRLHYVHDTALIVLQNQGLLLLDLTNPSQITKLGVLLPQQTCVGATRLGHLVISAEDTLGFRILDISNPASPVELSHIMDSTLRVTEVVTWDSLLWIGTDAYTDNGMIYSPSVRVYSLADPASPTLLTRKFLGGISNHGPLRILMNDTSGTPNDTTAYIIAMEQGDVWSLHYDTASPTLTVLDSFHLSPASAYVLDRQGFWFSRKNLFYYGLSSIQNPVFTFSTSNRTSYAVLGRDSLSIVGAGDTLFFVFSIADPTNPLLLDSVYAARALDFEIVGSTLLRSGTGGFQTYDISDPTQVTPLGSLLEQWQLFDLTVQDTLVYIQGPTDLFVVNIANPAQPLLVQDIPLPVWTSRKGLVSTSFRLFLSTRSGLRIYSLDTLTHPILTHVFLPSDTFGDLDLEGNLLFALWRPNGAMTDTHFVLILDITDPDQPVPLDTVPLRGNYGNFLSWEIDAQGDYVYVVPWNTSVSIIDVHDPTRAFVFRRLTPSLSYPSALSVWGNYAHVGYASGYEIHDIGSPWADTMHTSMNFPVHTFSFAHAGTWATLIGDSTWWIFDPYADTLPHFRTSASFPYALGGAAARNQLLYTETFERLYAPHPTHLRIYDMSSPGTPTLQNDILLPSSGSLEGELQLIADTLLLTLARPELHIFSLVNSTQPLLQSSLPNVASHCFSFQQDLLYTCPSTRDTLQIYDLTNLSTPIPLHALAFPTGSGLIHDISVQYFYAYLAQGNQGLGIYNVANPYNVYEIGRWAGDGWVYRVAVLGRFAYVLEKPSQTATIAHLHVLDISNPAAPLDVGYYWLPNTCKDLQLDGNRIHILTDSSGFYTLEILDLTPPLPPQLLSPPQDTFLPLAPITFQWNHTTDPFSGIQGYELQLSMDSSFSLPTVLSVADTVTVYAGELSPGSYFWRVRAQDGSGLWSDWSTVFRFTVDGMSPSSPIPLEPVQGVVVGDTPVNFSWTKVVLDQYRETRTPIFSSLSHHKPRLLRFPAMKDLPSRIHAEPAPVQYFLFVDTIPSFNPDQAILIDTLSDTTATLTGLPEKHIYWRVRAQDLAGNFSAYSPLDSFVLDLHPPLIESTTLWTDTSALGPFPVLTFVSDSPGGVDSVWLFVHGTSDTSWNIHPMQPLGGGWYGDTIPQAVSTNDTIRYYIQARDLALPPHRTTAPPGAPDSVFMFVAAQVGKEETMHRPRYIRARLLRPGRPRSGIITLVLDLPGPTPVHFSLYDPTGRQLRSEVFSSLAPGQHTYTLRLPSSGIFFLRIQAGPRSFQFRFFQIK